MHLSSGRSSPRPHPVQRRTIRLRGSGRPPLLTVALAAAVTLGLGGVGAVAGSGLRPARTDDRGAATGTRSTVATARTRLPDVPWIAQRGDGRWVFARGDRPPVRVLPAGELAFAIDRAFVASVVPTADGQTIVRFRDATNGRQTAEVLAPIWVSAGAFTLGGLVVTGYGDSTMTSDGGLLAIDPATTSITRLVEGGAFATSLGSPVARGEVLVSPNGRTVASNACGAERCALQVVDLETGEVRRPVDGGAGFLRALTDDAVVTTDDAGRWISGRATADGRELWRRDGESLIDPAALEDGSVIGLVGSAKAGWAIATIDGTGEASDLTRRGRAGDGPPRLWRALMTPGIVVHAAIGFEEALGTHRALDVTIRSTASGRPQTISVQLPAEIEAVP